MRRFWVVVGISEYDEVWLLSSCRDDRRVVPTWTHQSICVHRNLAFGIGTSIASKSNQSAAAPPGSSPEVVLEHPHVHLVCLEGSVDEISCNGNRSREGVRDDND